MPGPLQETAYERNAPDARVVRESLATTNRGGVFWIEDAGQDGPALVLTSATTADLAIVGGGYLGLWTAVLAKRRNPGQKVILLEAQRVGWAASGRNGGFCEAPSPTARRTAAHGGATSTRFSSVSGETTSTNSRRTSATLPSTVSGSEPAPSGLPSNPHEIPWLGDNHLDQDSVRSRINSPLFLGGSQEPDGCALVHPARLANELARVARHLGVEIYEHSSVTGLSSRSTGKVRLETARAVVTADRVALATNVFPSLLRRNRLMTVPVYDYVLMTEPPLSADQLSSIGWNDREGLADMANQFHYSRLTADNRILYGGYDAVYHAGRKIRATYEDRPHTYEKLASHFFATFPQLEGLRFSHQWAGAIDTCTQFAAYYGLARQGRIAYAAGFTGLGVGATRFAANVLLDKLSGERTERTELEMVRKRPLPFPPEPAAAAGINLTRWSLNRADHQQGQRNAFLRALDAVGLGFDS